MTPGRPVPPPLGKPLRTVDETADAAPYGSTKLAAAYGAPRLAAAYGSTKLAAAYGAPRLAAAYGATSADSGLVPLTVARRAPKEDDVEIEIDFCGLCHSDVHATRGEWGAQNYP